MKKYNIALTGEEREFPEKYAGTGKHAARNITRAGILPLSPEGGADAEIVKSPDICPAAVCSIRKRFSESGLNYAPDGRPFPGQTPGLDGKGQAAPAAAACPAPPDGQSSRTMQMIAGKPRGCGLRIR